MRQPAQKPGKSNGAVHLTVQSIRVQGSTVFPDAELDAAAARISNYYRERGCLVARAYPPAQDIQNGTLAIASCNDSAS